MRHGRKNKNKVFNGYKQHLSTDLDTDLILSAALLPANRQEAEAAGPLLNDIEQQGFVVGEMYIDRGYVSSDAIKQRTAAGAALICKPHDRRRAGRFAKSDFDINMRARTIGCPGGQVKSFELGGKVQFDAAVCAQCPLRAMCTASKNGRAVGISLDEPLQHRLRKQLRTRSGRAKLRQRTKIEHRLAHHVRRTGRRARYAGLRKNLFSVRRAAAIQNLETIRRKAG